MKQKGDFDNLDLPKRDVPQSVIGHYLVYRDSREFLRVEAASALEALRISGIGQAYKIQRDSFGMRNVLRAEGMATGTPHQADTQTVIQPVMAEEAEIIASPATQSVTSQPAAADAPLSPADIDKLLQG